MCLLFKSKKNILCFINKVIFMPCIIFLFVLCCTQCTEEICSIPHWDTAAIHIYIDTSMSVYNVSTNSTLVEHFSTCLPALYLQRKRSQGVTKSINWQWSVLWNTKSCILKWNRHAAFNGLSCAGYSSSAVACRYALFHILGSNSFA